LDGTQANTDRLTILLAVLLYVHQSIIRIILTREPRTKTIPLLVPWTNETNLDVS